MARGTFYTIYKITDEVIQIDKDFILENTKAVAVYPDNINWHSVSEVFPLWFCKVKYERDEKTGFKEPEEFKDKYVRKSDGMILEKLASWTFNSSSIFLMDDIFNLDNHPNASIITAETASEYVAAVDFLEHFATNHGKDKDFLQYLMRRNGILRNFNDNGYMPLPTSPDMEDQTDFITAVRDVLQAFLILLSSDSDNYSDDRKPEYLLTIGYWG